MKTLYLVMSSIVNDLLACSVFSIVYERAFSSSGYFLNDRRSQMSKELIEAELLINVWTITNTRTQDVKFVEFEKSFLDAKALNNAPKNND